MQTPKPSGFSISSIAIRQHIGTLMLTLAVIVVGIFFIFNLQVDLLPSITYPRIGVRVKFITQTAIGATVIVGAVLLVGIVVNNAIIMIELANQIRERDRVDRQTAIIQAAPQRFRPVLMTTITTVVGMFPLALGLGQGGEFLQPLGIVVFSGLALATVLTLFIIPCFYLLLHDLFGKFSGGNRPSKQTRSMEQKTLESLPQRK